MNSDKKETVEEYMERGMARFTNELEGALADDALASALAQAEQKKIAWEVRKEEWRHARWWAIGTALYFWWLLS